MLEPEALGRRFGNIRVAWLLGGWLAVTLVIALNRGIALLWGMTWLLAAALIVGWIFPHVQLRGVRVRRHVPAMATVGEAIGLDYEIQSGARPRYALELLDRLGDDVEPVLAAFVARTRGHDVLRLRWTPALRGRRVLDAVTLQCRFPLAVATSRRTLACERQEIVVYPRIVPLRRLPADNGGHSVAEHDVTRERRGRDEYAGVRPYHAGDEPRAVHWRASARGAGLVVREFDRSADRQLWIFPELALGEHRLPGRDGTFEMMFCIAHSVLHRAQAEGIAIGLVCRMRGQLDMIAASRERAAVARIRDALALLDGDNGAALAIWMARERATLPRGGSWLLFAGDDTQRRALIAQCRARGATPVIVQFDRASFGKHAAAQPHTHGARFSDGAWLASAWRGMDLSGLF
jgi:uncharacterized protein (DUF58 family)